MEEACGDSGASWGRECPGRRFVEPLARLVLQHRHNGNNGQQHDFAIPPFDIEHLRARFAEPEMLHRMRTLAFWIAEMKQTALPELEALSAFVIRTSGDRAHAIAVSLL